MRAAGASTGAATGGGGAGLPTAQESEPNDGGSESEVDDLTLDVVMGGVIGTAGDADVFRLPTSGGAAYEAVLAPRPSSPLEPHLTIFDDGRGGDPPADDYVKIVRGNAGASGVAGRGPRSAGGGRPRRAAVRRG